MVLQVVIISSAEFVTAQEYKKFQRRKHDGHSSVFSFALNGKPL
jgi:hypothetical protein